MFLSQFLFLSTTTEIQNMRAKRRTCQKLDEDFLNQMWSSCIIQTLCNLCLYCARQDGQDRKKNGKKITKLK